MGKGAVGWFVSRAVGDLSKPGLVGEQIAAQFLYFGDELAFEDSDTFEGLFDFGGFCHVVVCAGLQGIEGAACTFGAECRKYNDGGFEALFAQFSDGGDTVHLGHLDVHRDDIGLEEQGFFDGDFAIGSGPQHFYVRVLVEDVADEPPHDDGVIDN